MSAVKETFSNIMGKVHGKDKDAPQDPTEQEVEELKLKYDQAGQGQVFAFFDELKQADKSQLFHQLTNFEPNRITELAGKVLQPQKDEEAQTTSLEPLSESATASIIDSDPADLQKWYDAGLAAIADSKVAVVLMAGGQGTRLGSSAPKGCFDIGLPSKKTLFQIQAERIARLQKLAQDASGKAKPIIPWYVMTSGPTRQPTESFFEEHNYFGLERENVKIFEQGVLPCISNEGKILLESKSKVRILSLFSLCIIILTFGSRLLWLLMETAAFTKLS